MGKIHASLVIDISAPFYTFSHVVGSLKSRAFL
jgi:hypothetical protein